MAENNGDGSTAVPDRTLPTEGVDAPDQTTLDPNGQMYDPSGAAFDPTSAPMMGMDGFVPMDDPSFMAGMNGTDPTMMALPTMPMMPVQQPISADEIALYDRQIRLWGMQVQEKLRNANILLIGMKALGNEIAKNLVLAGIGTLTIMDHEVVTEHDLGSQFFVAEAQVGQNRADAALPELQKLNPRVTLFADPNPIFEKQGAYFASFDITIATGLPMDVIANINMACRGYCRKFYAADTHGMYGYAFADLFLHDFIVEQVQSNVPPKVGEMKTTTRSIAAVESRKEGDKMIDVVTNQEMYSPIILANASPLPPKIRNTRRAQMRVTPLLSCLRALFDFQRDTGGRLPLQPDPLQPNPQPRTADENRQDLALFTRLANEKHLALSLPIELLRGDFLRSFLQNLGSEIAPVVAYVGGFLAQDIINVVGQKEAPLQNFLLFDGEEFTASQFSLHPFNDDSLSMMPTNGSLPMEEQPQVNGAVSVA